MIMTMISFMGSICMSQFVIPVVEQMSSCRSLYSCFKLLGMSLSFVRYTCVAYQPLLLIHIASQNTFLCLVFCRWNLQLIWLGNARWLIIEDARKKCYNRKMKRVSSIFVFFSNKFQPK